MIKNYKAKFNYLYRRDPRCHICKKYFMAVNTAIDLHHKCHKKKWRIKKYPLFIDSILNLEIVHNICHLARGGHNSITDYRAAKIELFLVRHPAIARFVNDPAIAF